MNMKSVVRFIGTIGLLAQPSLVVQVILLRLLHNRSKALLSIATRNLLRTVVVTRA